MIRKSLHTPNGDVAYWTAGAGEGPTIVFTHGATLDHRMFEAQVEAFADRWRILAWDVDRHGRSRPFAGPFSIERSARNLVSILEQEKIEDAVLVGQSMGGLVSQLACGMAPERIRGLVGIGCPFAARERSWGERLQIAISPWIVRAMSEKALRKSIGKAVGVTRETQAYGYETITRLPKADICEIWEAVLKALKPDPTLRFAMPVLVVLGEHDNIGSVRREAEAWAARAGGEPVVIEGAGHNANQDNPAAFNALLARFLEALPTDAR